jgi:hypothetical protein
MSKNLIFTALAAFVLGGVIGAVVIAPRQTNRAGGKSTESSQPESVDSYNTYQSR